MMRVLAFAFVGVASAGGKLNLDFTNNGNALGTCESLAPPSIVLGANSTVVGSGIINETVTGGTVEMKTSICVPLIGCHQIATTGQQLLCEPKTFDIPPQFGFQIGSVGWGGLKCPMAAGKVDVDVWVSLSSNIPKQIANAHIDVIALSSTNEKLLDLTVISSPAADETAGLVDIEASAKEFTDFKAAKTKALRGPPRAVV